MTTQLCPICRTQTTPSERYPRHVCQSCAARASSAHGRLLSFSNVGFSGGFIAHYAGTDEVHDSHECFIDGIECWADEARFGGIVIEVV
ncbi:MAG: hypothetical protein EOP91_13465 [Lysobacteraceae bacterium]|nr:MAG: hypothetical protein EOP91_13465 [Xanthomonadaceae bacterium]